MQNPNKTRPRSNPHARRIEEVFLKSRKILAPQGLQAYLVSLDKTARLRSIVGIAKNFDLKVIAEGVETDEQGRVLDAALRGESSRRNIS
ncbi:hypothetical protein [Desulfobulbus sp.]|uniref:hypothetical protein n=1 Tax=Desulfobulbus sp. TaxID=895 RepID=UPI0027BAC324|nr:hypothetical protein [Desulfobulbus sp.]